VADNLRTFAVYDVNGGRTEQTCEDEDAALMLHMLTVKELDPDVELTEAPMVEEIRDQYDEHEMFAHLARFKWLKGRKEYAEKYGKTFYDADSLEELLEELLDTVNYIQMLYWDFCYMAEKFKHEPRDLSPENPMLELPPEVEEESTEEVDESLNLEVSDESPTGSSDRPRTGERRH